MLEREEAAAPRQEDAFIRLVKQARRDIIGALSKYKSTVDDQLTTPVIFPTQATGRFDKLQNILGDLRSSDDAKAASADAKRAKALPPLNLHYILRMYYSSRKVKDPNYAKQNLQILVDSLQILSDVLRHKRNLPPIKRASYVGLLNAYDCLAHALSIAYIQTKMDKEILSDAVVASLIYVDRHKLLLLLDNHAKFIDYVKNKMNSPDLTFCEKILILTIYNRNQIDHKPNTIPLVNWALGDKFIATYVLHNFASILSLRDIRAILIKHNDFDEKVLSFLKKNPELVKELMKPQEKDMGTRMMDWLWSADSKSQPSLDSFPRLKMRLEKICNQVAPDVLDEESEKLAEKIQELKRESKRKY